MVQITEHDDAAAETSSREHDRSSSPSRASGTKDAVPDGDADASRADPSEIHRGAELAEAHKATGNSAFAEGRWADAEHHYTLALETLPAPLASDAAPAADLDPDPPDSGRDASLTVAADAARPRGDRPRAVYHANRAACRLRMERYAEAVDDCTAAVEADDGFAKAWLRRGSARERTDPPDVEGALADCERALRCEELPAAVEREARTAVERLRPLVEAKREEMKAEMIGKLKDLGNSILGNFGLSTDNFKAEKDETTGSYSIQFVQNPSEGK